MCKHKFAKAVQLAESVSHDSESICVDVWCSLCGCSGSLVIAVEEVDWGDDSEEEDESDLVYAYEEASGNTVLDNGTIVDESGRYVADWNVDMAREYVAYAKQNGDE